MTRGGKRKAARMHTLVVGFRCGGHVSAPCSLACWDLWRHEKRSQAAAIFAVSTRRAFAIFLRYMKNVISLLQQNGKCSIWTPF
jgi:hypothetical protein